jgi:hypothetical protein
MKMLINKFLTLITFLGIVTIGACQKDETKLVAKVGASPVLTTTSTTLVLKTEDASKEALNFTWSKANFNYDAAISYTLEIDKKGANFANLKPYLAEGTTNAKKFTVEEFNNLTFSMGLLSGVSSQLEARIKASIGKNVAPIYSDVTTINVTPYSFAVVYPALMINGRNSWSTPTVRTNGFVLTSPDFSNKYEGYIYLPNADGYGGDALQLTSTVDQKVYGWGGTATTLAVGSGNLYFTTAPNYMKVNADVGALTVNFTPVRFFISGDDNNWSTSATPLTYNQTTRKLVATNVNLTAGKTFVFTSNGSYDISYKINNNGKLVYAGPPSWAGNNIPVTKTGVYTVTLDLSAGNGNYTYAIQ